MAALDEPCGLQAKVHTNSTPDMTDTVTVEAAKLDPHRGTQIYALNDSPLVFIHPGIPMCHSGIYLCLLQLEAQ